MFKYSEENIKLFASLFYGRQDVFAVHWEKDGKSGYMPAYKVDWSDYNKHKATGGTFKDYSKKEYLPFSHEAIINHFSGKDTVGIYPLLEDNTSFFIAADFDEKNWRDSVKRLYNTCTQYNIPEYIERSRSGNGCHVWIFFKENFPAEKSRKIFFELLRYADIISQFEKDPGFDRLFPNQDFHSGKALGSLIALPFNGRSIENANSCFLNPDTLEPYSDQWKFLFTVRKASTQLLDSLYLNFFGEKPKELMKSTFTPDNLYELEIIVSNQVYLKRLQLNKKLIFFLRENLNFLNSDYLVKKNLGKSTFMVEKYFRLIYETPEDIMIPRGFASNLILFCKKEKIMMKNLYIFI